MNLQLSEEQTLLQGTLDKVLGEHSTGARIRAAEPVGMDVELWKVLARLGLLSLRVPDDSGGNASLMHAVVAAEAAGRHLASVPLIEAIVASRLLSLLGDKGKEPLERCLRGEAVLTLALQDCREPRQMVPGGAVADYVLALDGEHVVLLSGLQKTGNVNLGSIPVASLSLADAATRVEFDHPAEDRALFHSAVVEWHLLQSAMIASAARRALEMAADYARERIAFGKPIGGYQGLAHPLADSVADVEGARLFAWRAVDAMAKREKDASALASLSLWWAATCAPQAALKSMRTFGGYGMTMEYDAQLYYRRITAWSLLAGNPDKVLDLAVDQIWGEAEQWAAPDAGDVIVDFAYGSKAESAAARMRDFCSRHHDTEMDRFQYESADGHLPELWRSMAQERLLYPQLPDSLGGSGEDAYAAAAMAEVFAEFGWNMFPIGTTDLVAKMILQFATAEAQDEILPKIARGEAFCCLAYTEPSGGSDIFGVRTSAVREGDEWSINGQKIFTSVGHVSDYALMITRTAPDKYAGVTLFIVPLAQPGYTCTEIKTIGNDRTNVTFYDNVRVPDRYRMGAVNGGVKVMAEALTIEQSGGDLYTNELRQLLRHAERWAAERIDQRAPVADSAVRRCLGETMARMLVQDCLTRRTLWAGMSGVPHKSYGPMSKLFGSESWLLCARRLLEVAAPWSILSSQGALGQIEKSSRRAIPGTIYAGTSEVQRSLIAESALGLPRSRS